MLRPYRTLAALVTHAEVVVTLHLMILNQFFRRICHMHCLSMSSARKCLFRNHRVAATDIDVRDIANINLPKLSDEETNDVACFGTNTSENNG